eukprot:scaffold1177_cov72-Phaeocystis_antarctica.AAC.2
MATLPASAPATAATPAAPLDSTAPLCTSRQLDGRCRGLAPLLPEGGLRREEVRALLLGFERGRMAIGGDFSAASHWGLGRECATQPRAGIASPRRPGRRAVAPPSRREGVTTYYICSRLRQPG